MQTSGGRQWQPVAGTLVVVYPNEQMCETETEKDVCHGHFRGGLCWARSCRSWDFLSVMTFIQSHTGLSAMLLLLVAVGGSGTHDRT